MLLCKSQIIETVKLNSYWNGTQSVFSSLSGVGISIFEVMGHLSDKYQNAISRAMLLLELKKVQLQERFTLMTHNSIGHLKTLGMSIHH